MNPSTQLPNESIIDYRARLQREVDERHATLAAMEDATNWARWLAGMKLVAAAGGWLDVTHLDESYLRANIETSETDYGDDHPFQKHFGLEGYHDAFLSEETDLDHVEQASVSHNDGVLDIRVGFSPPWERESPAGIVALKRLLTDLGIPLKTDTLEGELANLNRNAARKVAEIAAVQAAI